MKKHKKTIIFSCLTIAVLVVLLTGGMFSKYKESVELGSANVTVTSAKLADKFTLQEHGVVRQEDGSYKIDEKEVVYSNSYTALPGDTLPKDPYITIEKDTKVEAYLYVEVISPQNSKISYTMDGHWKLLSGITGAKGGTVYVYTGTGTDALVLDEETGELTVNILEGEQVTVAKGSDFSQDVTLEFYGYLAQASAAGDATAVYRTCFLGEGGN